MSAAGLHAKNGTSGMVTESEENAPESKEPYTQSHAMGMHEPRVMGNGQRQMAKTEYSGL